MPPNHIHAEWNDEQSSVLKGLMADGFSLAQCAVKLNERFGTSRTRNAAIGRANRLGLASNKKPKPSPKKRHQPYKPRLRATTLLPVQTILVNPDEIKPLHTELKDLTAEQCRWPYGHSVPYSFCGHQKASRWYCASHEQLSTRRT